jgi:acetyl-CoA synthetase
MLEIEGSQYNIGHICTSQQCSYGRSQKDALRWMGLDGDVTTLTFGDLENESNKFANVLDFLKIEKAHSLFLYLSKSPELFACFLGALKKQVVCSVAFLNFGEIALHERLEDARARIIVSQKSLLPKVLKIEKKLPDLKHILLVDIDTHRDDKVLSLSQLMQQASAQFQTPVTAADVPSVLHYTSGSTGKPKGVLHVHGSVLLQHSTAEQVLNITSDDLYWCTADQAWITGTSYGIIGPWSMGATQLHYAGSFNARKWLEILSQQKVTLWYSAPTVFRMIISEGPVILDELDFSHLRAIFSVGEPLNPHIVDWFRLHMGVDIYDTWFQTETGAIMIANRPGSEIRPGSMGKPVPGISAEVLLHNEVAEPGTPGDLVLKSGWSSMFVAYLNRDEDYRNKFKQGYYFTGDMAVKDADGYFWFKGRSDDIINVGGHLVSPFEVESALLECEEVLESCAIGVPDEVFYERVVVFVVPKPGIRADETLDVKLRLFVTRKISTIATPHKVIFVEHLPKNKSGKYMRRLLKSKYLGQNEGDTSTLED